MSMRMWIAAGMIMAAVLSPVQAADEVMMEKKQVAVAPLEVRVQWWREARFGMFIHFGPVSLKGTEIGWSRAGERRDRNETITQGVPADEYDNLYRQFSPTRFDARQWVATAKAAGMKYVVLTAKHHDGFCLWDTRQGEYSIMHSPFGRDLCRELADACHEAGMRLGFYYSPPDWHHPDFMTTNHARYIQYMHAQVRELLANYGQVDILWFDGDGGENKPTTWDNATMMPMVRQLQPQILLTRRAGGEGDFDTPEQQIGGFQMDEPWETCMTLCDQWSWKPDDRMKSLRQCLQTLIHCAGGDGNLLFNVGPMPDGRIEPRQVERLNEMGAWLQKYGQTIYGTRGGPWKPLHGIVSTRKGNAVFVHVLEWHGETLQLPAIGAKVVTSSVLTGGTATVMQGENGVRIAVPAADRQEIDTIIQLELDRPAMSVEVR